MKKYFIILAIAVLTPVISAAQYVQSAYFMNGTKERLHLNPALTPVRGYISIPVLGGLGLGISSSLPEIENLDEFISNSDDFFNNESLFSTLQNINTLNVGAATDAIAFGFHAGDNFFSFSTASHINASVSVPKSLFEFIRDINNNEITGNRTYKIDNENISVNAYQDIALGYARTINENITIGGRVKILLGCAYLDLNVNRMDIEGYFPSDSEYETNSAYADIHSEVELKLSGKGMEIIEDENGYMEEFEFEKFGFGGYGAAIDLGVNWQVTDNISLSASLLDFGFINWGKDNSSIYSSKGQIHRDNIENSEIFDFELMGLKDGNNSSFTSYLASTFVAGAEYSVLDNKIGFGIVSTTRFENNDIHEKLTGMVTFRPTRGINATVSYSTFSGNNSLGAAIKLGALFLGTDCIFNNGNLRNNAYLGIAIPIGGKKMEM